MQMIIASYGIDSMPHIYLSKPKYHGKVLIL